MRRQEVARLAAQFFQFGFYFEELARRQPVHETHAVEMVVFVLNASGKEPRAHEGVLRAFGVEVRHAHLGAALDFRENPGERQAAFLGDFNIVADFLHPRVDRYERHGDVERKGFAVYGKFAGGGVVASAAHVYGEHALLRIYLGRGKPQPVFLIEGVYEVFGEVFQRFVERFDLGGPLF